jgi:hypothetical protein
VAPRLADIHHVIAIDHPGFGDLASIPASFAEFDQAMRFFHVHYPNLEPAELRERLKHYLAARESDDADGRDSGRGAPGRHRAAGAHALGAAPVPDPPAGLSGAWAAVP